MDTFDRNSLVPANGCDLQPVKASSCQEDQKVYLCEQNWIINPTDAAYPHVKHGNFFLV